MTSTVQACLPQTLQVPGAYIARGAEQGDQLLRGAENALREHRRRGQRQARRQLPAPPCVEKFARLAVEDVELKEVVGQRVVIYAVLGVEPLAVEDVAAAER